MLFKVNTWYQRDFLVSNEKGQKSRENRGYVEVDTAFESVHTCCK